MASVAADVPTDAGGRPATHRALQLKAPRQLELVELPRRPLDGHQVRVRVRAVGICGSDLTSISGALPFTRFPIVPGHEASGQVLEAGSEAAWAAGDRVILHPILFDPADPVAQRGEVHHCTSTQVLGVVSRDGAYADEMVVKDYMLRRLPDGMDYEAGALVEPTTVALRALRRLPFLPGSRVLLLGCGSIGLLAVQVARALGAGRVVVADIAPDRLELALHLGADEAIDVSAGYASPFCEESFDLVVDGVGIGSTVKAGIDACVRGGALVIYGVPAADTTLDLRTAFVKDLAVATSRLYGADMDEAMELVATNRVRVKEIITHRVRLEDAAELLARVLGHTERPVKAVIEP